MTLQRSKVKEINGYTERFSNDPRGSRAVGATSGNGEDELADCRALLSADDRTNRTGLAAVDRLRGAVVEALENAWRELPEIMRRIVTRIHYK